jgi:hypothetical protein
MAWCILSTGTSPWSIREACVTLQLRAELPHHSFPFSGIFRKCGLGHFSHLRVITSDHHAFVFYLENIRTQETKKLPMEREKFIGKSVS